MEKEIKETASIIEAEKLQKSGWELLSAVITGVDDGGHTVKKYKFKKGNGKTETKHIFQDPFDGREIK